MQHSVLFIAFTWAILTPDEAGTALNVSCWPPGNAKVCVKGREAPEVTATGLNCNGVPGDATAGRSCKTLTAGLPLDAVTDNVVVGLTTVTEADGGDATWSSNGCCGLTDGVNWGVVGNSPTVGDADTVFRSTKFVYSRFITRDSLPKSQTTPHRISFLKKKKWRAQYTGRSRHRDRTVASIFPLASLRKSFVHIRSHAFCIWLHNTFGHWNKSFK